MDVKGQRNTLKASYRGVVSLNIKKEHYFSSNSTQKRMPHGLSCFKSAVKMIERTNVELALREKSRLLLSCGWCTTEEEVGMLCYSCRLSVYSHIQFLKMYQELSGVQKMWSLLFRQNLSSSSERKPFRCVTFPKCTAKIKPQNAQGGQYAENLGKSIWRNEHFKYSNFISFSGKEHNFLMRTAHCSSGEDHSYDSMFLVESPVAEDFTESQNKGVRRGL